ncbi:MAG TPA: twin-arginine translocase TatA/TatE family subunit [Methylovirgula sp.]|nr:twin-arginine translocase TatA/TatE family subunit [Methylovirgula sp.]
MGGTFSIWHLLILGAVVLILFGGKGKISEIMGDVAKGIKSFKKGLAEEDAKPLPPSETPQALDHRPGVEVNKVSDTQKAG